MNAHHLPKVLKDPYKYFLKLAQISYLLIWLCLEAPFGTFSKLEFLQTSCISDKQYLFSRTINIFFLRNGLKVFELIQICEQRLVYIVVYLFNRVRDRF